MISLTLCNLECVNRQGKLLLVRKHHSVQILCLWGGEIQIVLHYAMRGPWLELTNFGTMMPQSWNGLETSFSTERMARSSKWMASWHGMEWRQSY